jgi:hypothetical protein
MLPDRPDQQQHALTTPHFYAQVTNACRCLSVFDALQVWQEHGLV